MVFGKKNCFSTFLQYPILTSSMFHRIYFTDATPDNIVVDPNTFQITFIDLDNLMIVNSRAESIKSKKIHRNEQIDCDNCFAYVPDELCAHHLSDINIFAMCQVTKKKNTHVQTNILNSNWNFVRFFSDFHTRFCGREYQRITSFDSN